mgnify:CR=1 FL=1|tara:strand:+ start:628 stop:888 length:261 start_codon:yes stop_codon:yes gene_type:complete
MVFLGLDTDEKEQEYSAWLKKLGISGSELDADIHTIFYDILGDDIKKANECTEKCLGATLEQYEGIIALMRSGATFETAHKSIIIV